MNELIGKEISIDTLKGRNFYHYINGEIQEEQQRYYSFPDFFTSMYEEDINAEEDETEDIDESEELYDYLPDDCWVKRISDEEDPDTCHLLVLTLDEKGIVQGRNCLIEYIQHMGGGGFVFTVPGMELPALKSYDNEDELPQKIYDEIKQLLSTHILPYNFSFINRKLPQTIIDEGGNGGDNTEYTYALQSAYRCAYMHMSIDTDVNGVIKEFSYSTYRSTGSAYWDMFSRPEGLSDRDEEAIDMLLYLIDHYDDKEYEELMTSMER